MRLDIRRIETLKDGTEAVGNRTRVKVVKNKMAPPFKQAEFDILYGVGISREGRLIDFGVEQGIVRKSGAWYTYDGDQLGQGKENSRKFLRDNPDIATEIEKRSRRSSASARGSTPGRAAPGAGRLLSTHDRQDPADGGGAATSRPRRAGGPGRRAGPGVRGASDRAPAPDPLGAQPGAARRRDGPQGRP